MASQTIGKVARATGVHIETLRYYERQGLFPNSPRTASGSCVYPEEAVRVLRFVKRAQELGFTLKEIKELLALRGNARASCRDVREAAERQWTVVREQIEQLTAIERVLRPCLSW